MKSKQLILLILLLLGAALCRAEAVERKRSVVKSFKVNEKTSIQVINKYGNIHLVPWKKDSVRFEISVSVSGSKAPRVDRIFTDIDFDFTDTRHYIIARTVFRNSMNNLWSDITDMTNTLFSGGNKATIHYTVYFPEDAAIRIENKFGNVYTTDHSARVEISLSNGDLQAAHFYNELILDLSFGNARIQEIAYGRLNVAYGEFVIEEIGEAEINGKSAEIRITEAGKVRIDSRRDKLYITSLSSLSGVASFSYIDITRLSDEAILTTKYGDLSLGGTNPFPKLMDITAEYTDIHIKVPANRSIQADLTYDEKTRLVLNQNLRNLAEEKAGADGKKLRRSGISIPETNPNAKLRINLIGGSIRL